VAMLPRGQEGHRVLRKCIIVRIVEDL
jgi:hypothetical protein